MHKPSNADAFEVLCLQAADEGRGEALFGSCLERARTELRPFMVGSTFPSVYLEFPLIGNPFLDVTVLYGELEPRTRVDSPAAEGSGPMLDWFAQAHSNFENISCGFELDVKVPSRTLAAVHFQPRHHVQLVAPFCEAAGIPHAAPLYLDFDERMPSGWEPSFFGVFRGREGSPLRVCGYLANSEKDACADDSRHLASIFDEIGFSAYDETMLEQASQLMRTAPGTVDYQFDVYPDGTLGNIFAIDAQFALEQPENVRASFTDGPGARVMGLLEGWGVADERWKLAAQAAFARAIPVQLDDGTIGRYGFTLMPQWVKARWTSGVLQPSKLYHGGSAKILK